jgi:RNA polymerase sigma-70 factor (ECF subfamily)
MSYSGAAARPGQPELARPLGDLGIPELVGRARDGSLPCFAELVKRFEGRLFNFLLRRTQNTQDAEDLVQDTFVRAWQRIDQYNARWQFSTWLYTIAHRLAIAHRQRQRRQARTACLDHVPSESDPARPAADREQCRHIWALADQVLPETQRAALWLRYAEGLGTSEIARVLGKSRVGVRVMLFRARETLAANLRSAPIPRTTASTKQQLTGELAC